MTGKLSLLIVLAAAPALAQPTVDGSLTGDTSFYGSALATQDTRTGFGDANNPDAIIAGGGSELDGVFARISGDRLYVMVTGNLEDNFNKLNVFIDSGTSAGVNQLNGAALPAGLDGFCCGGFAPPNGNNTTGTGALQRMNGLAFDSGFTADRLLIITNGGETVNPGKVDSPGTPGEAGFWAVSASWADLTDGTAGRVGGLGMQLAPGGAPRVLRDAGGAASGDYNNDGTVNAADYTLWRDSVGTTNVLQNDPTGGTIGQAQYDTWKANFGQTGAGAGTLGDYPFKPSGNPGNTADLTSAFTLTGLGQGELIDRTYALGAGGCTSDAGVDCSAREFEFALNVDPAEVGLVDPAMNNSSSHRNFNNFVDLRLGFNNSNTGGVTGSGDDFALTEIDTPADVNTGIEFSVPLSQLGTLGSEVRLAIMIGGGNHDFLSNQVLGEGGGVIRFLELMDPGTTAGNIGGLFFGASPLGSFVDLPGNQFVRVAVPGAGVAAAGVPEPSALTLLCLLGAAAGVGRLRRAVA
ncbi:hypothetical protein Pla175_36370 [Pirellulimonas nuda]|uniref:PEP-CTERM protein-sorting domain-containing protein n=1 Tax=Pirellulimonas nuda TaxID=2528009 RepID=A0A518DFH7_9BACT|nr:hypothetical protein [Pirellulimonas nuda]QDU90235.1 hypothetical protein Pla175_36370 [Pirellulimonas nuda]